MFLLLVFGLFLTGLGWAAEVSTAAAVSQSTAALQAGPTTLMVIPEVVGSTAAVKASAPPKKVFVHRSNVKIHKEAADWEPISVSVGGSPEKAKTYFSRRVKEKKVKGKKVSKGEPSKATACVRLHKVKDDWMLVVSVYPASLRSLRKHLELRYLLVEGYLEGVKVAAVTVDDPRRSAEKESLDSFGLGSKGIAFHEDYAASAEVSVSVLDSRPGKSSFNAGSLESAEFGEKELGTVNFGYAVQGVRR